jgi:hypothetical protein
MEYRASFPPRYSEAQFGRAIAALGALLKLIDCHPQTKAAELPTGAIRIVHHDLRKEWLTS